MRERIKKELSHESDGIDIKLGTGGVEEIEFFIQYLQLRHAATSPDILTANTPAAISILAEKAILNESESMSLSEAYNYFRKIETFLRLNGEKYLTERSENAVLLTKFLKAEGEKEFIAHLKVLRDQVMSIVNQH